MDKAFNSLLHNFALKFFRMQIREALSDREGAKVAFTTPVVFQAVRTLKSLLAPSSIPASDSVGAAMAAIDGQNRLQKRMAEFMAFTVSRRNPADAKRIAAGELDATDMGISVHEIIGMDNKDKTFVVSTSPVSLGIALGDAACVSDVALVLSLSLLPLASLQRTALWTMQDEQIAELKPHIAAAMPECSQPWLHMLKPLLQDLMGGVVATSDGQADFLGRSTLLKALAELGVVAEVVTGFCSEWTMTTEHGKQSIRLGSTLSDMKMVMSLRRHLPLQDMTMYEMLTIMQEHGFRPHVYHEADKKALKDVSYRGGDDDKVFYIRSDGTINKQYLIALLSASADKPVPALASSDKYLELLGLPRKRKQQRRPKALAIRGDESWDDVEQRAKRPRAPRRPPAASEPVLRDLRDDASAASSSSSSKSSSSSSSSTASTRSAPTPGSPSPGPGGGPAPPGPAGPAPTEPLGPVVEPPLLVADVAATDQGSEVGSQAGGQKFKRHRQTADMWGLCRLTPRWDNDTGACSGFQINCSHPDHAHHAKCNKSLAASVPGSITVAERMLKYWVILGYNENSKEAHKLKWEQVVSDQRAGHLPTMDELDAKKPVDWTSLPATGALLAKGSSGSPSGSAPSAPPSAPSSPRTPPDVQERMQVLIDEGRIPATTKEQRRRNRLSTGAYRVSECLQEALKWQYVHPNLKSPLGLAWKGKANRWSLAPMGG